MKVAVTSKLSSKRVVPSLEVEVVKDRIIKYFNHRGHQKAEASPGRRRPMIVYSSHYAAVRNLDMDYASLRTRPIKNISATTQV
jgi:hypothetical protein